MKHFWVFAFVSIIITAFFGGFAFPERGYAQSIDSQTTTGNILNQTTSTQDPKILLNQGIKLFTDQIKIVKGLGASTDQAGSNYVIQSITDAQQIFQNAYSGNTSGDLAAAYKQGMSSAYNYISGKTHDTSAPMSVNMAPLSNVLPQVGNTLHLESLKQISIQNGVAKGLTPAEAAVAAQATVTNAATQTQAAVATVNKTNSSQCTFWTWTITGCITEGLTWFVKSIILNIVGFFLWMSANLLNFAMYHGVFKFKDFAPDEIYSIWLVVRQIISLFVFFAGLFVGFMAIIGKSEEFKKYVAFLVVFGLFVNFSYPIVRVFVDISNVVSLQIYQTTLGNDILLTDNPSGDGTAGARIMRSMGLQGLASSATSLPGSTSSDFIGDVTSLPGAIAVVAVVGSAAYILFMIAVMLIVRTALLVCIIIASPILLVDAVVPALGKKAQWLRGVFISQLFVAPVFAIMLALTLKFLDIFSKLNTGPNALTGAGANTASVFFNLIMMLVMLWIMYKVTKAVAGSVGDTVTGWAGKAGGLGTGLAIGAGGAAVGFGLRNTAGRFAKNLGEKDIFGSGIIGNYAKDALQGMGKRSYDLRNLSATGSIAGTLGITGMGQGSKKSYAGNREEYEEKTLKRAGEIGDDEKRAEYLDRRFNQTGAGKFVDKLTGGTATNSKAYKNFVKGDEDTMKQYINANEEGRKKMMEDEKNKKYLQRFGNVDTGDQSKMSAETEKAYIAKKARDDAQQTRNESRVVNYLTSDQATRESLIANAKASDDKELQKQLAAMEILSRETAGQINQAKIIAAGITDPNLINKIIAKDQDMERVAIAQANQATANATQQTNATTLYNAQLATAQAVQNAQAAATVTAQQTKLALDQMVQGNADIANLLKGIMQNSNIPVPPVPQQNTGTNSVGQQQQQGVAV